MRSSSTLSAAPPAAPSPTAPSPTAPSPAAPSPAGPRPAPFQPLPFDSPRWRWQAADCGVESYLGRSCLRLQGGLATVADASFADGGIEFDIAFTAARGFMGGVWRVQDGKTYEEFYLRPHQSGNPDANQYTPVFHGVSGWQLYHGERYAVPATYPFESWMRVRILFAGPLAEIYLGPADQPALFIDGLKGPAGPGSVGLSAGPFAAARFSNFAYLATASPPIQGRAGSAEKAAEGVIPCWWVSDPVPEGALGGKRSLGPGELAGRSWTCLEAEPSGLTNLARAHGIQLHRNTVFAATTLRSDRPQTKRLDLGFSDRVRVYLGGRLLFRGDDSYRSRDYRFLGSIGYFDALYLPLEAGDNELLLAVSEDLGGWGIQAKLEDLEGITLPGPGSRALFNRKERPCSKS